MLFYGTCNTYIFTCFHVWNHYKTPKFDLLQMAMQNKGKSIINKMDVIETDWNVQCIPNNQNN